MNYEQFCKEMSAIDLVSSIDIDKEPPPVYGPPFGRYVITFTAYSRDGAEISATVKHFERSKALEAALNLAVAFCSDPVL